MQIMNKCMQNAGNISNKDWIYFAEWLQLYITCEWQFSKKIKVYSCLQITEVYCTTLKDNLEGFSNDYLTKAQKLIS